MSVGDLHFAIEHLDESRVQTILEEDNDGVYVNKVYRQETALTRAVHLNSVKITKVILEHPSCCVNTGNQFDRTPLYYAALNGNLELIKTLIAKGGDINLADIGGVTPLSATAWYDHSEVSEFLIKEGGNLNLVSRKGETPLYRACSKLSINTIKVFICNGCDVNLRTTEGKTPFIAAVLANDNDDGELKSKRMEIMTLLLENGCNLDIQDNRLYCALHYAVEGNDLYSCSLMIENGCNCYLVNNENMTPFDIATSFAKQYYQIAILFFMNGFHLQNLDQQLFHNIMSENKYLKTDMRLRQTLLSIVLQENIDKMNVTTTFEDIVGKDRNITELSSICVSTVKKYLQSIKSPCLLQQKCRAKIRALLRQNLLHRLKQLNLPQSLKIYISYGINITHTWLDVSRLFLAVEEGVMGEVKRYLKKGVDKDIIMNGQTLLMTAAKCNNIDAVSYLLEINADCDYESNNGTTAINLAVQRGNHEIVVILSQCDTCISHINKNGNTPFQEALSLGDIKCALILGKYYFYKPDINKSDRKGIPPLHYAVGNGNLQLTSVLVKNGACVNQPDMNGNTALHVAATKGTIYLRDNIELPGLFDSKVHSSLFTASLMMCDISEIKERCKGILNSEHFIEIVNFLLGVGCDLNIQNNNNKKAVELAVEYGLHDDLLMSSLK